MNLFEELNTSKQVFDVKVENPTFKKLSAFAENDVLNVLGCYINKKSVYGAEPIFIVKDRDSNIFFVNMPKHKIETVNKILNNENMIRAINKGECYIEVVSYFSKKYNKQCSDFNFIDSVNF